MNTNKLNVCNHTKTTFLSDKCFFSLILLLLIIPPIIELIFIGLFGVNLVFWDQWGLVPLIEKQNNGTLTFGDLYTQHNEHRVFFPKIIMLILGQITHYNTIAEMYFSWTLAVITLFLIFKMYRHDFGTSTSAIIRFVPIVWIFFSLRQFENILWGWQISIYLTILGFVASIYSLDKAEIINYNFLVAIFSGIISTFSFMNGLLVWPVGLVYLILSKVKSRRLLSTAWAITGVIVWFIYFYHWIKPSNHPSVFFSLEHIGMSITYLIMNIGAPLAFEMGAALGMGFILLTLMIISIIFIVKNKAINENAKWIAFILFSLTSSLSMTIGRSGFGVNQGLESRYVTITLFGVIGLYLIIVKLYEGKGNNKNEKYTILYGMILSIILVGMITGYAGGFIAGESVIKPRELYVNDLFNYQSISDEKLEKLFPNADYLRKGADILEKYRLNIFYMPIPEWNTLKRLKGGVMYVDSIRIGKELNATENNTIISKDKDQFLYIIGWAADDIIRDGTVKTFLIFKGENEELSFPTIKMSRQDVADYYNIESFREAGWSTTVRSEKLNSHCYTVLLRILRANGQEYFELDGNKTICFE